MPQGQVRSINSIRVKFGFSSKARKSHSSRPILLKLSGCIQFTGFYNISFGICYVFDLMPYIFYDLYGKMTTMRFFLIVPVLKILRIFASFYYVCVTILCCMPICDSVFLGLSYLFQDGSTNIRFSQ